jgi:hypothetical protein
MTFNSTKYCNRVLNTIVCCSIAVAHVYLHYAHFIIRIRCIAFRTLCLYQHYISTHSCSISVTHCICYYCVFRIVCDMTELVLTQAQINNLDYDWKYYITVNMLFKHVTYMWKTAYSHVRFNVRFHKNIELYAITERCPCLYQCCSRWYSCVHANHTDLPMVLCCSWFSTRGMYELIYTSGTIICIFTYYCVWLC